MTLRTTLAALALATAASTAQAATLYGVTGPAPFGFQSQRVMAMAWSQANTYSNVAISAPLADLSEGGPIGGTEGIVYLVNQIGPGTTMTNDVAPPVLVSGLGSTFAARQLWTGLTLPPGTYYLVFASVNSDPMSMSPQGTSTPATTAGPGVAPQVSHGLAGPAHPFPPASAFTDEPGPGNLFITVTGDADPVPGGQVITGVPALSPLGVPLLAVLMGWTGLRLRRRPRVESRDL